MSLNRLYGLASGLFNTDQPTENIEPGKEIAPNLGSMFDGTYGAFFQQIDLTKQVDLDEPSSEDEFRDTCCIM